MTARRQLLDLPQAMLLDLGRQLGTRTLEQGMDYAREGRVSMVRSEWPVVAKVFGSEGYVVTVHYTEANDAIRGECTCAVGHDCKHVAATALVAFSMAGDAKQASQQRRKQQAVGEWLSGFHVGTDPTRTRGGANHVVAYVLSREAGAIAVSVHRTTRLRSGSYGKSYLMASPADPQRGAPRWVPADDLRRIAMLRAVSRADTDDVWLRVDRMDTTLLAELADTGRLFWREVGTPALSAGPLRQSRLGWQPLGDEDEYSVGLPGGLVLVPAHDTHYLDLANSTIGPLRVEVPAAIVQQLACAPPVPAAMLPTVWRSLRPLLGAGATGLAPVAEPDDDVLGPRPHLFVTADDTGADDWLSLHAEVHYGDAVFELGYWDSDRVAARDLIAETRLARRLDQLVGEPPVADGDGGAMEDLRFARHVVQNVVPVLISEGWACHVAGDIPGERVQVPDTWTETLRPVTRPRGYFQLDLGVVIAGRTVSLLPILMAAIRDGKLPLDTGRLATDHSAGMNVRLPDGELVYVSGERLRRWARPLVEAQLHDPDGDEVHVPAYAAVALADDLDSQPYGDSIVEAGRQLEQLTSLQPAMEGGDFAGELRGYQREGLAWLLCLHDAGYGGLLADDMGLGKTVQMIAFFDMLRQRDELNAAASALVVAPRSVVDHWRAEIDRFAPALAPVVHLGADRARAAADMAPHAVVITSYETMRRDRAMLRDVDWATVVFDESQALKNPRSKSRAAAQSVRGASRFAITGTPVENNLSELWSQLDLVVPGLLGRRSHFDAIVRRPIEKFGVADVMEFLRQRIRPFLLRRTKDVVALDLPAKTEIVERVDLDTSQRDLYEGLRASLDADVRQALREAKVQGSSLVVLDALLKLRQCCCDPRLVKLPAAKRVRSSAKLERLMAMLDELADAGRHVLVFSQFTSMLALIERECQRAGIGYLTLTGATRDRASVIREFQEGRVPVFLISLKAGGTGLNLTRADTVIHYDPWWNPAAEQQATDRAHRIGQQNHVFVYKLVARGTLEERIAELQGEKRDLANAALKDAGATHLTSKDLASLYRQLA